MLKLKFQYLGQLIQRANSLERPWCWEGLKAGGEGDAEDEMVGWHHWLNGHESEQALGDGEEQGSLAWCSSWGAKSLTRLSQQQQQLTLPHWVLTSVLITQCGFCSPALWSFPCLCPLSLHHPNLANIPPPSQAPPTTLLKFNSAYSGPPPRQLNMAGEKENTVMQRTHFFPFKWDIVYVQDYLSYRNTA